MAGHHGLRVARQSPSSVPIDVRCGDSVAAHLPSVMEFLGQNTRKLAKVTKKVGRRASTTQQSSPTHDSRAKHHTNGNLLNAAAHARVAHWRRKNRGHTLPTQGALRRLQAYNHGVESTMRRKISRNISEKETQITTNT